MIDLLNEKHPMFYEFVGKDALLKITNNVNEYDSEYENKYFYNGSSNSSTKIGLIMFVLYNMSHELFLNQNYYIQYIMTNYKYRSYLDVSFYNMTNNNTINDKCFEDINNLNMNLNMNGILTRMYDKVKIKNVSRHNLYKYERGRVNRTYISGYLEINFKNINFS